MNKNQSINDKYRDILLDVFSNYIKDLSGEIYDDSVKDVIIMLSYPSLENPSLSAIMSFMSGMFGFTGVFDPVCYDRIRKLNEELIDLLNNRLDK